MKQTIVIAFLILTSLYASCQVSTKEDEKVGIPDSLKVEIESNAYYIIKEASKNDFENALRKFVTHFVSDSLNFIKKDSILTLPILNRNNVTFKDTLNWENEEIDSRLYRYIGNYPGINFYLVECKYYENYSCYLINKITGEITDIEGIPKISPKQDYLINIIEMGGMADIPIGFQIWKRNLHSNTWNLVDRSNNLAWLTDDETIKTSWYPVDFIWESDKVAILKVISFKSNDFKNNNFKDSNDCIYKKLIIK